MTLLQVIIHYTLGFVTSFIGSIPLGTINATVIRLSLTENKRTILRFIAGATLAELIYSFIAVHFSGFLLTIPKLDFYIRLVSIPIFILLGLYYFFSKPKTNHPTTAGTYRNLFLQGLMLGLLNPLQVPFWLAYGTYLISAGWINKGFFPLNIFIIGIISGSFTLLYLVAKFSSNYKSKLKLKDTTINQVTGGILIFLALYEVVKILFSIS
jgi:threonine/homoserine/homoserine lactone efflux protein